MRDGGRAIDDLRYELAASVREPVIDERERSFRSLPARALQTVCS
jgi:hypothetical protein